MKICSKINVDLRRAGGAREWEKAVPAEKKTIVHLKRSNLTDEKGKFLFLSFLLSVKL